MVSAASELRVVSADSFEAALDGYAGSRASVTREEWDDLLQRSAANMVFLTWQWQRTWWRHFSGPVDCKLHLLVLRDDGGALVGIAPLFVAHEPLPPVKEYHRGEPRPEREGEPLRIVQFVGGIDVADYLDVIAERARMETTWAAVLDYLVERRDEWDAIDFHSLAEFSPSREIIGRLGAERGLEFQIFPEDVSPVLELPTDWETYLMSLRKKDRHELRRKVRKLEGRDDVRWHLVPLDDTERMVREMHLFLDLHRQSGVDKAHFMDDKMAAYFLDMTRDLAGKGWIDLAILEVGSEPASAYLSYIYGDRLYLYNSGYSPRFAAYSAGVALLAYRIHKAILQGLRYFDFLRGDEPYKYDFGAKDTYVYRALCVPERVRKVL
jgi:CelD/BcsL family acetyltransferase involved in cellulose biosynthesis